MHRALVWLIAGCGFSPSSAPSDGSSHSDASAIDASIDASIDAPDSGSGSGSGMPRDCNAMWKAGTLAFNAPQPISELDTPALERDPFLSPDELTIYFSQEHTIDDVTDADIYTATRAKVSDPFGTPTLFTAASTSQFYESKMSISTDQLSLVVCRSDGAGGNNIYRGVRSSAADPWPTLSTQYLDANVNAHLDTFDPELGSNAAELIYAPEDTGVPQHLELATQSSPTSDYQDSTPHGYVADASYHDADPWLDASGQILVFSRGPVATDEVDIYYAIDSGSGFVAPIEIDELTSLTHVTGDPWVSPDGCRIYFSSDRSGNFDLYTAKAK